MNKLLFDEQPLIVSRELAKLIGLNEAIVLQQIHYWLEINRKANKNFRDERYWTYNSIKSWHENDFSFWSFDTVKRTFASLVKKRFLIVGNYNKLKLDQTKWYSVNYEALETLDLPIRAKCPNAKGQNAPTISADCPNGLMQNAPMDWGILPQPIPEITRENLTKNTRIESTSESTSDESAELSTEKKIDMTLTVDIEAQREREIISETEKEPSLTPKQASQRLNESPSVDSQYVKDEYTAYLKLIQDNIDYSHYLHNRGTDIEIVDELVNCMLDVIFTKGDTDIINGEEKSRNMVKSIYLKINSRDIDHVIDRYKTVRHKVTHLHSYLKTMIFTCKQENGHFYTNAVRVDGLVW